MNADDILTFSVDENQRHTGRLAFYHAYRRNIDIVAFQLLANTLAGIVITRAGNEGNAGTAAPSSNRLVSAFATKCDLILITGYGFTRPDLRYCAIKSPALPDLPRATRRATARQCA
jgi:hypothetical protein